MRISSPRLSPTRREFLKASSLASLGLLLGASRPTWGNDGPQISGWTSFRNGHQNHGVADADLPRDLNLLWEVESKDGIPSTPLIADGHAYCGTLSGDLLCLELESGKEVWKYKTVEMEDPKSFPPGFQAPIALDAEAVFGGDDLGTFHAVDRKTGKRLWTYETDGEIVGGPQIVGENVLFGSHDGFLYLLNCKTGAKVWAAETNGPINGTPCLSENFTFTTACDQPILKVFNIEDGTQTSDVPLEDLLIASAAVRNGILYFGSDSGTVYALDWQNKKVVWKFSVPNREQQIQSSPAVTDKHVFIGTRDKYLYAIDRESGEQIWAFQTRARIDSSPVVCGDRVFFGCSDKNLYAVNIADGTEAWKYFARQSITGSPAIAEGKLLIGTEKTNGKLLCFG
ncbi:MAG: PQQ-binding-like beta-propeller repeat protein [Planctomycetaceae bacterium]|nr:PQQ-binding-like beta-propeller repeat protein [Planctomycetaceae bacterium]